MFSGMRILLPSVVLLGSWLGACSSPRVSDTGPSSDPQSEASAAVPAVDDTLLITIEHSECYGWCPNYTLWVRGDGHVTYEGRSFVAVVGFQEKDIEPQVVRELVDRFSATNFFELEDRYRAPISDCSTTRLTLRVGTRVKTIENYWAGKAFTKYSPHPDTQEALDALAAAVDEAVAVENWIGTAENRRANRRKFKQGRPGRTELD
jgi:Domain of unknown function (DUF6438)